MPTKQVITEKLSRAYKVKPVFPSGRIATLDDVHETPLMGMNGQIWLLQIDGWRPERLNKGIRHWTIMQRAKDEAIMMFGLAATAAGCPGATGQRRLHLSLEGYRQEQHLPDEDAFDKVVLDSLKRAGLLTDDNSKGLLGRMTLNAVLGKVKRTVLLIGDVA